MVEQQQFHKVFKNKHVLLPVIHTEFIDQTIQNTKIARDNGCDGVFLVDMHRHRDYSWLLEIQQAVAKEVPNFWLGVNILSLPAAAVFSKLNPRVKGVWIDDACIDEAREYQIEAVIADRARKESCWKGLYFGGVAFRGQRSVGDLVMAARFAKGHVDVVTTSGEEAGVAPTVEKVRLMRKGLGKNQPLAVVGGITTKNIEALMPHVNCFLMNASLRPLDSEIFDPSKVREHVNIIRGGK